LLKSDNIFYVSTKERSRFFSTFEQVDVLLSRTQNHKLDGLTYSKQNYKLNHDEMAKSCIGKKITAPRWAQNKSHQSHILIFSHTLLIFRHLKYVEKSSKPVNLTNNGSLDRRNATLQNLYCQHFVGFQS
jgi:hypothetical protein